VLCADCRQQLKQAAVAGAAPAMGRRTTLCFQCYRAELDRDKAIKAAGELNTASVERFQTTLPFEPVNVPRLEMLKADRASASHANHAGLGRFTHSRRLAQIAARHALQTIAEGLQARRLSEAERERALAFAVRAAELQLPDAWLPFVVSR
jgi:hypothetical protein